jgi:ethanolamine utilization protein EutN
MFLGRVVGRVWATVKSPGLEGHPLLVVQPVTPELAATGKPLVCADSTGAGSGELVYYTRGREASYAFLPQEVPADNAIIAIVDEMHVKRGAPC